MDICVESVLQVVATVISYLYTLSIKKPLEFISNGKNIWKSFLKNHMYAIVARAAT